MRFLHVLTPINFNQSITNRDSVSVSYVSGHLKTGTLLICIPSQNDMLIHCCVTLKMAALTLPVILFIITTRLNVGQDWIMERVKDLKKINRQREGEREGEYQLN